MVALLEQVLGRNPELGVEKTVDEDVDGAVQDEEEVIDAGHDLGPDGEGAIAFPEARHGLLDHHHLVEVEDDSGEMTEEEESHDSHEEERHSVLDAPPPSVAHTAAAPAYRRDRGCNRYCRFVFIRYGIPPGTKRKENASIKH